MFVGGVAGRVVPPPKENPSCAMSKVGATIIVGGARAATLERGAKFVPERI